jgi:hypothetical protein
MKIVVCLCVLVLAAQALEVSQITEEQLQEEMSAGKHFWLVHRTSKNANTKATPKT